MASAGAPYLPPAGTEVTLDSEVGVTSLAEGEANVGGCVAKQLDESHPSGLVETDEKVVVECVDAKKFAVGRPSVARGGQRMLRGEVGMVRKVVDARERVHTNGLVEEKDVLEEGVGK